jgi:hypothetical protein
MSECGLTVERFTLRPDHPIFCRPAIHVVPLLAHRLPCCAVQGVDIWGAGCIFWEILTLDFLPERQGMLAMLVQVHFHTDIRMHRLVLVNDLVSKSNTLLFFHFWSLEQKERLTPRHMPEDISHDLRSVVCECLTLKSSERPSAMALSSALLGIQQVIHTNIKTQVCSIL